jgi:hypothetical protein
VFICLISLDLVCCIGEKARCSSSAADALTA